MKNEKQGESWILTPETSESEQAIIELIARFGGTLVRNRDGQSTTYAPHRRLAQSTAS